MPAKSEKQERFMRAVAHSPSFAKKVGVPMSVGREFTKAEGGQMKESKAMMKKEVSFMKKKGAPKSMIKHEEAEMKGTKKMAGGGMSARRPAPTTPLTPAKPFTGSRPGPTSSGSGRPNIPIKPPTAGTRVGGGVPISMDPKRMVGGGLAAGHKSADGIAKKGKTDTKRITMGGSTGMKKGGMAKMKYGGKC